MGPRSFMLRVRTMLSARTSAHSRRSEFALGTSIVRCRRAMKRVFSHRLTALVTGLLLRLFFLFELPSSAGDTALYETLSQNWVKHGIYGLRVDGVLTPVDIRMP